MGVNYTYCGHHFITYTYINHYIIHLLQWYIYINYTSIKLGEIKNCTREAERSSLCLKIELEDYKFWSHYQRCGIIFHLRTKIHTDNSKILFSLSKLISIPHA